MADWRDNLLVDEASIAGLVRSAKRVAVLGIRSKAHSDRPAYYVPAALSAAGVTILPVPVYPEPVDEILGQPLYATLAAAPGPIDIVDVFRRPSDIPPHLPDLLAARPRAVWFQSGIRNDEAAQLLAQNGILVVQDRCLMVDHRRFA
ncbi:MAG: CoA-binding protein [Deltaproteobacteria bacterium]